MTANDKIAAVGATAAACTAIAGAVVESLPLLAIAAGVGVAAASVKLIGRHRRQTHDHQEELFAQAASR